MHGSAPPAAVHRVTTLKGRLVGKASPSQRFQRECLQERGEVDQDRGFMPFVHHRSLGAKCLLKSRIGGAPDLAAPKATHCRAGRPNREA